MCKKQNKIYNILNKICKISIANSDMDNEGKKEKRKGKQFITRQKE